MTDTRDRLVARVLAWMDGALRGVPPEPFDDVARAIHTWQRAHDPLIARLAPEPPTSWHDLPAIPVDAFKQLAVGTVTPDTPGHVAFRTSGTTAGVQGVHRLRDTRVYDHGAQAWARRCVPDLPHDVVALLPDPAASPDSSLAHMVAGFAQPPGRASWHLVDGRPDVAGATARWASAPGPVFLAATAFALADLLDAPTLPPLPPGSVLMVTGGFKGRRAEVDGDTLYAAARARLGVRRVVVEYGMTELSSQLWGVPGEALLPPPWLVVQAVDPATGAPRAPGEAGQLRFTDLANVDSTLRIDTLDQGIVHGDGSVTLLGRLPGADARGCSLPVEDAGFQGPP